MRDGDGRGSRWKRVRRPWVKTRGPADYANPGGGPDRPRKNRSGIESSSHRRTSILKKVRIDGEIGVRPKLKRGLRLVPETDSVRVGNAERRNAGRRKIAVAALRQTRGIDLIGIVEDDSGCNGIVFGDYGAAVHRPDVEVIRRRRYSELGLQERMSKGAGLPDERSCSQRRLGLRHSRSRPLAAPGHSLSERRWFREYAPASSCK